MNFVGLYREGKCTAAKKNNLEENQGLQFGGGLCLSVDRNNRKAKTKKANMESTNQHSENRSSRQFFAEPCAVDGKTGMLASQDLRMTQPDIF